MHQIDYPDPGIWNERRDWFETLFDVDKRGGGYILGEHALGLLPDLQAAFCVGAWNTVIILATTIIDAQLREAELDDQVGSGIKAAFDTYNIDGLNDLRLLRNRLVHFSPKKLPPISVDMQWMDQPLFEQQARSAIKLVADVFFSNPWI